MLDHQLVLTRILRGVSYIFIYMAANCYGCPKTSQSEERQIDSRAHDKRVEKAFRKKRVVSLTCKGRRHWYVHVPQREYDQMQLPVLVLYLNDGSWRRAIFAFNYQMAHPNLSTSMPTYPTRKLYPRKLISTCTLPATKSLDLEI